MITPPRSNRHATTLICVLVCVSVSTAIASAAMRETLRSRRNERLLRQMRQTEFLMDAGVHRAAQQLRRSADYRGELWRPTAALTGFDDVRVEIEVSPTDEPDDSAQVRVVAKLTSGMVQPTATQRSHTFVFNPSHSSN